MRWEDTDCGDNGMEWAISSCNAMRSDETKRQGIRSIQELVAAKYRVPGSNL